MVSVRPKPGGQIGQTAWRFDGRNPAAQAFAQRAAARYVTRVSDETRDAIQTLIVRAIQDGVNVRDTANLIRSTVGLTSQGSAAVKNYYNSLLERGENAQNAWKLTDKYSDKLLAARAKTIARTETMGALNGGALEQARQRTEAGIFKKPMKKWMITKDEETCLPAKTPVMTINGWVPIASVKVGDSVLTHQDRFREVTAIRSKYYDGQMTRLEFYGRSRISVGATTGHPILTSRGWVPIEQITLEDEIIVLAQPCVVCGKLNPSGTGGTICSCTYERAMKKWNNIQIPFVPQWLYTYADETGRPRYGFADFFLPGPGVVIECDGPFHKDSMSRDVAKDSSHVASGYVPIRFTQDQIMNQFSDVASTIRGYCCFMKLRPKKVKHYQIRHQSVHDLQVKEDESFVAGGVVVHNCKICRPLEGQVRPLMNPFSIGVMAPPAHPNCRCAPTFFEGQPFTAPIVAPVVGVFDVPVETPEERRERARQIRLSRERRQ